MTSMILRTSIRTNLRPVQSKVTAAAAYRIPVCRQSQILLLSRDFSGGAILQKKKHGGGGGGGKKDDQVNGNDERVVPNPALKVFNLDSVRLECEKINQEFKDAITSIKQGLAGSGQLGKIPVTAHIAEGEMISANPTQQQQQQQQHLTAHQLHQKKHEKHHLETRSTGKSPVRQVALEDIAQVTPAGPKKILISVYDPKHVQPIIAAVMKAGLNLNPQLTDPNNPLLLTVPIPPLTSEAKKQQLDQVKDLYEKFRRSHSFKFSLDRYRSTVMTEAKKALKANLAPKDDVQSQINKAEALFKQEGQSMLSLYERAKKSFD